MKVTGLFVDVTSNPGKLEEITIDDELEEYYKMLSCDYIDIATRMIGDRMFDIVCDDEGLLKDSPIPSAITGEPEDNKQIEPMLLRQSVYLSP